MQLSGQYTRVIPDPRAERMAGADWVDPDTRADEGTPPVGGAPVGEAGDPEPVEEPPAISERQ
jgi:hypothetical protein